MNNLQKKFTFSGEDTCSPLDLRTFTVIMLSFVGFLRYSQVSELYRCDLDFQKIYGQIFIDKSKTRIYWDGHCSCISKLGSNICPAKLARLYLTRREIQPSSAEHLFRAVTYFNNSSKHNYRKNNSPISYSWASQNVLSLIENIGLNSKGFNYTA